MMHGNDNQTISVSCMLKHFLIHQINNSVSNLTKMKVAPTKPPHERFNENFHGIWSWEVASSEWASREPTSAW